ncbi:transcriptional regulator, GntR family [Faunimonas pinastri]|uniref:Transcriptional regulator, GntR family n=1 Tax=Faunimonas pinastri TaxID=1855383 RepID=A0A1H9ERX4_9HYPH|nr:GntR family transcriptional regulator [Faunimonas pinastri]SEQ27943.1 transcriptional regulator, GntR family [Faunimonas pinastri]
MGRSPIQRRYRLANQILDVVREARFEPGHHLREQALGDLLQVSRTPVRSALMLLADHGVLEAKKNHGFFLKASPDELQRLEVEVPPTSDQDLYTLIVQDRLAKNLPDSFIQSDIARRYDADRAALQKTLTRLVDDGLLQRNAGRGWTFMPTLDTGVALSNSYDFRRVLEPAALLLPGFTPDPGMIERVRLQHLYLEAHPDIASVDRRQLFETDRQFHEMLVEFCGNPFFLQAIQQQNRMRRLLEFTGYSNRRRVRDWCREHLAILDAVEAGNQRDAARLMSEHLEHALQAAPALSKSKARPARKTAQV